MYVGLCMRVLEKEREENRRHETRERIIYGWRIREDVFMSWQNLIVLASGGGGFIYL